MALALHTESEAQIHAAELECSRASLDTTDLRSWLRSALEARFRGRFELARTQADGLPTVLGAPLDVAVDLVHTWGLRDRPDALLSHLDARAAQFPRDHRYTTWITRWRRLALYQRGDYLAALACALDDETTGDLCNRAACLIELGRAEEAIDVASRAEGLALVDRSPFLSAQARWLVRYSHCRARRPLPPDAALVDDAETFSIQHAALFAFTDAVAAWRLGRPTLASTLADRAQALFRQRNRTEPALLAGAFRCFLTRDTAGAQRLLPFVPAESRSDAVIQAMALLRAAGLPTVTVPASPRPTTEWDWHLDVLSIRETLMLEPLDAEDQEESESHPRISAAR